MKTLIAVLSVLVIFVILWDAFESMVLPRRVTRRLRLTSSFYRLTWWPVAAIARRAPASKKRDRYLSYYGPLSLVMLLLVWACGLILAFAALQWSAGSRLQVPAGGETSGNYIYMSGVIFFTLGFGDVTPLDAQGRALAVAEAGVGFGFLAIVIGYLPVIYQSFSRREVNISLLDARAGSPPTAAELIGRHAEHGSLAQLGALLRDWEHWAADLLESHLSYPVLCYYRSQHDNQSWLASLTAILDACALVIVGVDGAEPWQAQLTFAIARHAVVDLAQVFNARPTAPAAERLTAEARARLRRRLARAGVTLREGEAADARLDELRGMYEPFVNGLACELLIPLPPWVGEEKRTDNWQTSAWGRASGTLTLAATPIPADEEHR